ncbi:synaptic vesicle glycoprotein 2C-like isoform X2 [Sipha flava]|uniref:Synaptic vesicle glycoprotein 2C-like isoform X2 n=1 Tax=Sipha flava TaxID=143950 RepID=A0A8B8GL22_9HEMI|nr:synaptic vesicle glycoprotein 2C-like isoform X2 [Sipha flava]
MVENKSEDDVVTTTTFLTAQSVRLDKAIEMIGFGKFHYYMLFICGTVYIAVSISLTSVSFIVPSAQCDFQMTSFRKGFLNGASMIGMCIGSFIWGYISDSYGRRKALIFCMLMDGLFNLVSSVSQIYSVFIFCRMMSGFGVSGCTITYAYLGEFLNAKYREKFLCWMEIFWTIGVILLPCIAWIIIPQTFRIESGFFLFRSWNLFVIICSLPSIITTCLLMLLPESPKYLLVKGKHEETLDCLRFVHRWNNKKTDQSFPVISLTLPDRISETSKGFFSGMGKSLFELITSKYKTVLAITCIMQFCVTASYYMMMLWFPELMNRLRWYETTYPSAQNKTTMCEVLSMYKVEPNALADVRCNDDIDGSVYLNILIVGVACLPLCFIVPLYVNKLGLRFFLATCLFGSGLTAVCLYYISSSMEILAFASVFEALSSTGFGLIFCVAVELFPVEYTGLAVAIGSTFGKIGSIVGNVVVGIFIDAYCIVPIVVSCSFLLFSGFLIFTLPKTIRNDSKGNEN